MKTDAEFAMAENGVLRFLLLELADAMVARGALKREDIAGALLRAEWGAEVLDNVDEEEGRITRPHAELAKLTTEQWSSRIGLEPSLHGLRKQHTAWLASGQQGHSPLRPEQVIDRFHESDEGY